MILGPPGFSPKKGGELVSYEILDFFCKHRLYYEDFKNPGKI